MCKNYILTMRKTFFMIFALAGIAMAGCGSDRQESANTDSLITDTSMVDTASTDSVGMVDSAVNNTGTGGSDTTGGGAGTPRQP